MFLNAGFNEKIDCWTIGVIAYQMLTGRLPFYSKNTNMTINLIIKCEPDL